MSKALSESDTILDVVNDIVLFRQNTINRQINYPPRKLLYSGKIVQDYIVAGTIQNNVEVWSVENGQVKGVGQGHRGSIFCVLEGDNGQLFTGSDDRSIRIWRIG